MMPGAIADTFSMEEVAAMLECTPEIVVDRIQSGELVGLKYGRGWVFPRAAFMQRLNDHALEVAAARREQRKPGGSTPAPAPLSSSPSTARRPPGGRRVARTPPPLPSLPASH